MSRGVSFTIRHPSYFAKLQHHVCSVSVREGAHLTLCVYAPQDMLTSGLLTDGRVSPSRARRSRSFPLVSQELTRAIVFPLSFVVEIPISINNNHPSFPFCALGISYPTSSTRSRQFALKNANKHRKTSIRHYVEGEVRNAQDEGHHGVYPGEYGLTQHKSCCGNDHLADHGGDINCHGNAAGTGNVATRRTL